jgi:hypothetical protein
MRTLFVWIGNTGEHRQVGSGVEHSEMDLTWRKPYQVRPRPESIKVEGLGNKQHGIKF